MGGYYPHTLVPMNPNGGPLTETVPSQVYYLSLFDGRSQWEWPGNLDRELPGEASRLQKTTSNHTLFLVCCGAQCCPAAQWLPFLVSFLGGRVPL